MPVCQDRDFRLCRHHVRLPEKNRGKILLSICLRAAFLHVLFKHGPVMGRIFDIFILVLIAGELGKHLLIKLGAAMVARGILFLRRPAGAKAAVPDPAFPGKKTDAAPSMEHRKEKADF